MADVLIIWEEDRAETKAFIQELNSNGIQFKEEIGNGEIKYLV